MNDQLKSHADLAQRLKMPLSTVIDLRKREEWPHVKIGRSVRFTDEQIAQIIATHTTTDAPKVDRPYAGQTQRSARTKRTA